MTIVQSIEAMVFLYLPLGCASTEMRSLENYKANYLFAQQMVTWDDSPLTVTLCQVKM
jgi:hypothetical protein